MKLADILKKRILKFIGGVLVTSSLAAFPLIYSGTIPAGTHSLYEQILFSKDELKDINQAISRYNATYLKQSEKIGEDNIEEYVRKNTISESEMCEELKRERVVIFGDVHCFTKQREKIVDIIKKIKRENFVVGMEIFQTDTQGYIDEYLLSKISLEELVSKTEYPFKELKRWGYASIIEFLKKSNIRLVGIDMPSVIERNIITPDSVNVIIRLYSGFDFYSRDVTTTKTIKENIDKGKNIAIIIGVGHAEENHLPYMIKKIALANSAVVSQQAYAMSRFQNPEDDYKKFLELGLAEGKVLKIDKENSGREFCLNTKPNVGEMAKFLGMGRDELYRLYNQHSNDKKGKQ